MLPKPKVNILLVDDQPQNLLAMAATLDLLGQNLVQARSGEEALQYLLDQEFALILLDVQMPVMDGFETARLIRERAESQHTPIIFMAENGLSGYAHDAVDCLLKPVVPEILLAKVSAFISLFQKTQEIKLQAAKLEAFCQKLQREIAKRKQAELALQELNDQLKISVQQRTAELQEANERLEAEVKQRRQVEEALRVSEVRYQAIVENSYDIITFTDEQDNIYYQNSATERILGYSLEASQSKRPVHKVHHQDIPKVEAAMSKILDQPGIPVTVEYRMQKVDGSWATLESIGTNWLGHPDIKAIVANTRDISEHKQAEVAVGQRAERERLITASIQRIRETLDLDVILQTTVEEVRQFLQVDRVLVYRVWSDGTGSTIAEAVVPDCPTILGHTFPAEVFPQKCHPLYCQGRVRAVVNPETDDVAPCLVEFLRAWGVKSKLVVPIVCQGTLWGLLIAHQCLQSRQWQPLEMDLLQQFGVQLAIAIQQADLYQQVQRELAERKQAQEALRQARDQLEIRVFERTAELTQINKQLRAIFESSLDAIAILDEAGYYVEANPAACQLFGRPIAELLGKPIADFVEPGFDFEQVWRSLVELGQLTGELSLLRPDGTIRAAEYAATASFVAQKHLVVLRDITERKQTEEMRRALAAEKELRRLQLRFFSMVSHEFRTPLSTILGSAQLLKTCTQTWTEEKKLRNLNRIEMAAKNLTQLLDELLTINRAECGKLECHPHPINLANFCRRIVEDLQLQTNLKHQINLVIQGECPMVSLDEKLMRFILNNLLSNATKYSPQGGRIYLALTCNSKEAIFQIQDQGIGIPLEDQTHLFELFHRGKNVANIPGTGLGLSVVKKCLDLQGGKIAINSEVGVGTTVTVTIPLSKNYEVLSMKD